MLDIKKLDETLEQRVKSLRRSRAMVKMLKELSERDELFEYNVPTDIIRNVNDDGLLDYLQRTYSQSEFILEDPGDIGTYIKVGSEVVKKGEYKEVLEPGAKGIVIWDNGGGYAGICLEDGGKWSMPLTDLVVTYKRRRIRRDLNFKHFPVKAKSFKRGLMWGDEVEYVGKAIEKEEKEDGILIPDGVRGRVVWFRNDYSNKHQLFNKPNNGEVDVIWNEQPDLVQRRTNSVRIGFPKWEYHHTPKATQSEKIFTYRDIKLVKPNLVNFEELYKECFKVRPKRGTGALNPALMKKDKQ